MKTLGLFICLFLMTLISLNSYGLAVSGFDELTDAIGKGIPERVQAKTFYLNVAGQGDYELSLSPSSPFEIEKLGDNRFAIKIVDADLLYEYNAGFYWPKYEKIHYKVVLRGSGLAQSETGSDVSCIQSVSFHFNQQIFDFNTIDEYFSYDFEYDRNIFEYMGVEGEIAKFKRLRKGEGNVLFRLYSEGKEVLVIPSANLGHCQTARGGRPRRPFPSPRPNPPIADWTQWSTWSDCSASCGEGSQVRTRQCYSNGRRSNQCYGEALERKSCYLRACTPAVLTKNQKNQMAFKGVNISISGKDPRILSRRFDIEYVAVLTNPFKHDMKCDIYLESSRGKNRKYETIDTKVHSSVFVGAYSSTTSLGSIECKSGRGEDGLNWIHVNGHNVKAENCFFVP
jgi:hypothetical protein